ncbi:MAG TPA: hypothetical protein ENN63_08655, partial [Bacteroidetes bacterium]|nr:hypothetical protein [Bacteroidota bacterium]
MEKRRRRKACRDPNPSLTALRLSGTQTGSLHRPWRIFPCYVFLIKPSEAYFYNLSGRKKLSKKILNRKGYRVCTKNAEYI